MKKRIVICADGTWNRPEKDPKEDVATNVLRLARGIKPIGKDGVPQQVFYDWGIGSYYDKTGGGMTGRGMHKNIMDDYRYIVQNYKPGDEIYLFGFSRGAYTVRSLCGLINNCGILKRPNAELIQSAFNLYKKRGKVNSPSGENSKKFRADHSHASRKVKFVGVWDTVGAMGIPISFLGLFDDKDEFYDTKLGSNVEIARHALAIDEHREDFKPTIWTERTDLDLKQVWFAGSHGDVGGNYLADEQDTKASDTPFAWMIGQAKELTVEAHVKTDLRESVSAKLHNSRRSFYRVRKKHLRPIEDLKPVAIHSSVKARWETDSEYRPKNLVSYVNQFGWPSELEV